jgi:hypothetical protein
MAAAGTLLSDLDGGGGGGQDGDLVQKILADMNVPSGGGGGGGRPVPPPLPAQTPMQHQQMAGSMQQMTMDRQIPTSHMIGNEHPTPADFAAAMVGMGGQRGDMAAMAAPVMPAMPTGAPIPGTVYEPPSKNIYGRVVEEVKVPFVVALLFFVFSLPPIRVLVGHYMPRLLQPTGEFHITGLLLTSAIVGATFWVLQRVIAPLLSL